MDKLFETKTGHVLLSIIWGLGIAALLYSVTCKGGNCVLIKGPSSQDINNQVYQHDDRCYQYHPYSVKCGDNQHAAAAQRIPTKNGYKPSANFYGHVDSIF